jgi:hypothetical protein
MKFQITEQNTLRAVDQEARSYVARKTGQSTNTIAKGDLNEADPELLGRVEVVPQDGVQAFTEAAKLEKL